MCAAQLANGHWIAWGYSPKLINQVAAIGPALDLDLDYLHHIDLRDTFPPEDDYKRWWANELHPTGRGFKRVAARFHETILESTGH